MAMVVKKSWFWGNFELVINNLEGNFTPLLFFLSPPGDESRRRYSVSEHFSEKKTTPEEIYARWRSTVKN